MLNDAELLHRYTHERSEEAFAELVRRHLPVVYLAAARQTYGDDQLAQEVTQDVFVALARKAGTLVRHPLLLGWLYRSTQFLAIDALRQKNRRQAIAAASKLMQVISSSPESAADWSQLRPVIDQALGELAERDRHAILLRFFAGQSFPEIGVQLRLSEDGARRRVERATQKLRVRLSKRGLTSTTAALSVALADCAVGAVPANLAGTVISTAMAATAGGGATAAVFTLMKIKTIAVAALLLIGSAVLTVQYRVKNTPKSLIPVVQNEITATGGQAQPAIKEGAAAGPPDVSVIDLGGGGGGSSSQSPEQEAVIKMLSMHISLGPRYDPLFDHLKLPDDKWTKLGDLLTERTHEMNDFLAQYRGEMVLIKATMPVPRDGQDGYEMATSNYSIEDKSSWPVLQQAAFAVIEGQTKALLGDDAYKYYEFYQDALSLRLTIINHLQTHLSIAVQPALTNPQIDAILQVMANDNPHWPTSNTFTNLQIAGTVQSLAGVVSPQQAQVIIMALGKEVDYYAEVGRQLATAKATGQINTQYVGRGQKRS